MPSPFFFFGNDPSLLIGRRYLFQGLFFLWLPLLSLPFLLGGCGSCPPPEVAPGSLCRGTKRPYVINGIRYEPQLHYDYDESGVASWYGPGFHGKPGACGAVFDMNEHTAAHKTAPIPSVVEVTNVQNGKRLHLVINDRGPFVGDRIIDLSKQAAKDLGTYGAGLGHVRVKILPEESRALSQYLEKNYGAYGRDPSGRSWVDIYRQEILGRSSFSKEEREDLKLEEKEREEEVADASYTPSTPSNGSSIPQQGSKKHRKKRNIPSLPNASSVDELVAQEAFFS